ncbi:hypothetical protein SEA_FINKLE_79 [Gordonia phage Finkle]|uniref:Uncharacterized protein n=1 Tax=Gordonia phage Finkle TaxID=2926099 RepID=A0A9E7NKE6_9CAUD|nr:hypothetical protein QEH33_gp79 [Gordonia phage Finkle]UTN93003.1 hypothetical protein SEA_FINKLE_79 [Gordonia phage Finkle]
MAMTRAVTASHALHPRDTLTRRPPRSESPHEGGRPCGARPTG